MLQESMENAVGSKERTMEEIAAVNFSAWNEALQTKDPGKVALLYSDDATFLPTLSKEFENGQGGAAKYFKHFLEKNPAGKVVYAQVQALTPSSYLHSGFYNFEVDDGAGGRKNVEARFSFVWARDDKGEWKILHHHSSLKPLE